MTVRIRILEPDAPDATPMIHESYHAGWWFSDWIPRVELDNRKRPPDRPLKWPGRGTRCAESFRRNGNVRFHSTVGVARCQGIEVIVTLPRLVGEEALSVQRTEWLQARQTMIAGAAEM